ncbi:MAG: hypothetical protein FWH21_06420, partial [Kiritimatiellaeota bacterium]|nr:hypothetical protein [Kiritimatiellota bacterium]
VCFHTPLPHPVTAKVEPEGAFDGTFTWTYGNLTLTNNPVLLPRSDGWKTNWPGTVSVTFEVGGKAYATNCPVWYCQLAGDGPSTNAPPQEGEGEYCWRCGVWWLPPHPGASHGCGNWDPGGSWMFCGLCKTWYQPGTEEYGHPPCPGGGGDGGEGPGQPEPYRPVVHRGFVPPCEVQGVPVPDRLVRFYPHGGPGGGGCCPCPAHAAHRSTPAVLESVSPRVALYRKDGNGNLQPFNAGNTLNAGEAVYVRGLLPSAAPWDASAVFEWTEGGETEAQTNLFTVLGVDIVADIDLCGGLSSNDVVRSALPPPAGWAMPAATNQTWLFDLFPFTGMNGEFLLTLDAPPGTFRAWDPYGSPGAPLLVPGQTVTNPPGYYLYIEALAPGAGTLTYTFTGDAAASNLTCSATLPITARGLLLQPVTTETVPPPGGAIVNPAVVASNGLAQYTMDVVPPGIPDSDIEWRVAEGAGKVSFYNGVNRGRSVNVRGKALGGFKLEAGIAGMNLSPKPYIYGTVLEQTVTPLHIFVICDANGNPAVSNDTINAWVDRANRDFAQVAMKFTIANVTFLPTNYSKWFHIDNDSMFEEMCSYTNNTGGLEVYCVASLHGRAAGLHSSPNIPAGAARRGLAVRADAPLSTLGHEIGHACKLKDIKGNRLGNIVVSKDLVGEQNWSGGMGTGYYPSDLKHADLVKRLLMCQGSESRGDIPLGYVWAYPDDLSVQNPIPIAVGVNSMITRNPFH